MLNIHSPQKDPYESISRIAIAVKEIEGRQRHMGVLYRIEGGAVSLLHLRWHFQLVNELPNDSYFWISTALDDRVQMSFAEYLGVVWQMNPSGEIPYSIVYGPPYFTEHGEYLQGAHGMGLTCATFVMALFDAFNLPLVLQDTWPKCRLGDVLWQRKILKALREHADHEHIETQETLIGRVSRYRPEEVAGAFGIFDSAPVEFDRARPASKIVLDAIHPPTQ